MPDNPDLQARAREVLVSLRHRYQDIMAKLPDRTPVREFASQTLIHLSVNHRLTTIEGDPEELVITPLGREVRDILAGSRSHD